MRRRYVLAPGPRSILSNLALHQETKQVEMADRVESVIRDKIVSLAMSPDAGHWCKNSTDEGVKFFPVYSYLIVYHHAPASRIHSPRASRRGTTPQRSSVEKKDAGRDADATCCPGITPGSGSGGRKNGDVKSPLRAPAGERFWGNILGGGLVPISKNPPEAQIEAAAGQEAFRYVQP
jgi:plasmid stabilization system protein ParE